MSEPFTPAGRKADLVTAWKRLPPNTRGALFMVCGALTATLMLTAVKLLGGRIDSVQIVFIRAVFGAAVAIPLWHIVATAGWLQITVVRGRGIVRINPN